MSGWISSDPDMVGFWMAQAGRYPIPSKLEQIELARRVQAGMAEGATPQQVRSGRRAKERLFLGNLRLVVSVARKFSKRISRSGGLGFEDLLQQGCIGLNRAIEKFDPERGYAFSTYTYHWISQYIRRLAAEHRGTVRLPQNITELLAKLSALPPGTAPEAAREALGLSETSWKNLMRAAASQWVASLDALVRPGGDDDGSTLLELLAAPAAEEAEFSEEDQQMVAAAVQQLPVKHREAVGRALAGISCNVAADEIGHTRSWEGQLRREGVKKVRARLMLSGRMSGRVT